MSRSRRGSGLLFIVLLGLTLSCAIGQAQPKALRWAEGKPGCTFSADDDGRYRYGLWTNSFKVVIAVDADEVRKAGLRVAPLFAIFVTLRMRSTDTLTFDPIGINLEFVNHYHTIQNAIDPDDFAAKLQNEAEASAEQADRQISKHPEKESALRVYEDNVKQTREFLRSRSLRPARLGSAGTEVSGWVFFSAKSKWIDDWKKQEQFVLRVPVANQLVEFPFALPPSQGDMLLRRR